MKHNVTFVIMFIILAVPAYAATFNSSRPWHSLLQISGNNGASSVDADDNGVIDNSSSCSGDSNCETIGLTSTGNTYLATSSGNVGIGTSSPNAKLQVMGNFTTNDSIKVIVDNNHAPIQGFSYSNTFSHRPIFTGARARGSEAVPSAVQADDYLATFWSAPYNGSTFDISGGIDFISDGVIVNGNVPTRIQFATADSSGNLDYRLTIKGGGNVGIGTTNPNQKLQVVGNINATGNISGIQICIAGDCRSSWPSSGYWALNGNNLYPADLNYNIGIGTNNPNQKLHVVGNGNFTGTVYANAFSSNSPLRLQTGGIDRIYVDDATGRVGIGTTNPGFMLHVQGDSNLNGTINTRNMNITENIYANNLSVHGSMYAPNFESDSLTVQSFNVEGTMIQGWAVDSIPRNNSYYTLDSDGDVGKYVVISKGFDGLPILAYYDATNTALKFAKCYNTDCSSAQLTTVDNSADVGTDISMAVAPDGKPVISYKDVSNNALKVAKCGDDSCSSGNSILTVSTEGVNGTSLIISSDALPAIAFLNSTSKLKFIKCGTEDCSSGNTVRTIWSAFDFKSTSLAMKIDGYPLIVSYSVGNTRYKFFSCNDLSCSSVTSVAEITEGGTIIPQANIGIDTDGYPVIAYITKEGKAATRRCTNYACTLDFTTKVELGSGIALSSAVNNDGGLMVSVYYSGDLYFAKNSFDSSKLTALMPAIASEGDVGSYSALNLGVDGLPIIAYYDTTNSDLKIIKCANSFCTPYLARK